MWLSKKQDKRDSERRTTGAENPLGSSGVAKMMCEPVISRHAQSLKLWQLAWLSMIDIYLKKPVIHQCHISVGCETTNLGSKQKCFMASPVFPKYSDWTNLSQTAFVDPSVAALWLSQSSIIPTNA